MTTMSRANHRNSWGQRPHRKGLLLGRQAKVLSRSEAANEVVRIGPVRTVYVGCIERAEKVV
jgi:hypothetical protein